MLRPLVLPPKLLVLLDHLLPLSQLLVEVVILPARTVGHEGRALFWYVASTHPAVQIREVLLDVLRRLIEVDPVLLHADNRRLL